MRKPDGVFSAPPGSVPTLDEVKAAQKAAIDTAYDAAITASISLTASDGMTKDY